jgi:hypothetical protein
MSSPAGQPAKKHSLTIPDRSPGCHPRPRLAPHPPRQGMATDFWVKSRGARITFQVYN